MTPRLKGILRNTVLILHKKKELEAPSFVLKNCSIKSIQETIPQNYHNILQRGLNNASHSFHSNPQK